MAILAYRYADVDSRPHLRYVISEADYKIAEIKEVSLEDIARITYENANKIFEI